MAAKGQRQRKKERGRPGRMYPPRIDATPEQIAQRFLGVSPKERDVVVVSGKYRCVECQKQVYYPDTLNDDRKCAACA